MTSLTIRNLDPEVKQRLREQAARHGRSMEAEARHLIAASVSRAPDQQVSLLDAMRSARGPRLTDDEVESINAVRAEQSGQAHIRPGQLWWFEDAE
jgi:plasmid stability protein